VEPKSNIIVMDSTFGNSRDQRLKNGLYVCFQYYTKHRWTHPHSKTFNECITV